MYEIFEQLLQKFGVTPYKVSKDTGIPQSTLSSWKTKRNEISSETAKILAEYFNVTIDYLMTGHEKEVDSYYYLNDETREIAQEIFENKDLKILFDASRKAKPEDLKFIIEMAKRFKGEE